MATDCFESAPSRRFLSRSLCSTLALASALAASTLTGCGFGATDSTAAALVSPPVTGRLLGGATPIVGAAVKMYATGNASGLSSGYGVGHFLQEATQVGSSAHQDTDSNGGFSFAGGYTCPAGQFAYMVATGGNSGGNSVNGSLTLVAAMGRCEDLYNNVGGSYTGYKGTSVYINELSTIAAAYALGHFSNVTFSGLGTSTVVSIGAPATNNAAQIAGVSTGCVAGAGSCTATAAAGLAHAFQNAANLVNVFSNAGEGSNANTTVVGNSAAIVPRELINTIGNILISCVNSNGGSASSSSTNDGTPCGQLFSATTIGSTVPADTFSAMVNLAANPTLSGSSSAVASLYNLALPIASVYQPSLTSSTGLHDYSIAINYPSSGISAISYPMSGAVDMNDNYYAGNATFNAGNPSNPVTIVSFSSNGATVAASATNTTLKAAYGLSVDALGHGYIANGGGSGTSALGLFSFNNGVTGSTTLTTAGILTLAHSGNLKVYATAVDRANNVWALGAEQTNGTSNLYMNPGPYTDGTVKSWLAEPVGGTALTPSVTIPTANFIGLAIDPNQNVWTAASTAVSVVENNGSVATPTYTNASIASATSSGSPAVGISFVPNGGSYTAWVSSYNTTAGIQPFTPTFDSNTIGVSTITPGPLQQPSSITGSFMNEADGAGNIWVADTNSLSIQQFQPATNTAYKLVPCIGGATTCTPVIASPGKPLSVSVDSTGSLWTPVADSGAAGGGAGSVVEIIGSAAPTWPLLSLGKTGTP